MKTDISKVIKTTMTLKEITDLLDVRHNNAMRIVKEMAQNQDFGTATQIEYQYKKGNNAIGVIKTYQLDKRQSFAIAARLNTTLMMAVIDRWQELETTTYRPEVLAPQLRRFLGHKRTVPSHHFVAIEIVALELIAPLHDQGLDIFREMMPEGSFVRSWNKDLRTAGEVIESFPTHSVQTDKKLWVSERCYPHRLHVPAHNHFWATWLPEKAPKYLKHRQPQALPVIPVAYPTLQDKLNEYCPRNFQDSIAEQKKLFA